MKHFTHFKSSILRGLLSLFFLTAMVSSAWGTEVTWIASEQGYINGTQYTSAIVDSNISLSFGDGGNDGKYYDIGSGIRIYSKGHMTVSASNSNNITKIVITYSGTSNTGTMSADQGYYSLSSSTGTWNGSASAVKLSNNATSGHARIQKVVITYSSSQGGNDSGETTPTQLSTPVNLSSSKITPTSATLSWGAVTNASSYKVKIGSTEYNATTNSYSATGLTAGTQYTWTVKAIGDGTSYSTSDYATSANFTTEEATPIEGSSIVFIKPDTYKNWNFSNTGYMNSTDAVTDGTVSITATGSNQSGPVRFNTEYTQIYQYTNITFSVPSGYKIREIEFTCTSAEGNYRPGLLSTNIGEYSVNNTIGTWKGSSNSITFNASAQVRTSQIKITYTAPSNKEPYSVSFEAGVNGHCETVSLTEAAANSGITLPTVIPTEGYAFLGWSTEQNSETIDHDLTAGNTFKPSENTTLYAVYKKLYKLIIQNSDNGSIIAKREGNDIVSGTYLNSGETITIDATPAIGYTFKNWQKYYDTEYKATYQSVPYEYVFIDECDITIKANFDKIPVYTVTFNVNGASTELTETIGNSGVTPIEVSSIGDYSFVGWTKASISTETTSYPTLIEMTDGKYLPTENTTLYAVFSHSKESDSNALYRIFAQVGDKKVYMSGVPVASSTTINQVRSTETESQAQIYELTLQEGSENQYSISYNDNGETKYLKCLRTGNSNNYSFYLQGSSEEYFFTRSNGVNGTYRFTTSYNNRVLSYKKSDSVFRIYSSQNITQDGTEYYDLELEYISAGILTYYTTSPKEQISISSVGYATYVTSSALNFDACEGITAYKVSVNEGAKTVNLSPITEVPANEAIVVAGEAGTYNVPVIMSATTLEDNNLIYSDVSVPVNAENKYYVLAYQNNEVCFAPVVSGSSIGARKGYFTISNGSAANYRIVIEDLENGNETGMPEIDDNGEVPLIIYTMTGVRIPKVVEDGLYIVNGKTKWMIAE